MSKQNGSLNKKFDHMIERLDILIELVGPINKTLVRHEQILEHHTQILEHHTQILERHEQLLQRHGERLAAIEHEVQELGVDLLKRAVLYGDHILLQTETGTTKAGILRQ